MSSVGAGVLGWRCSVCGTTVDVATPLAFTCPRATANDRRHVLHPIAAVAVPARLDDPNPFVAYGPRMAWWAFARAHGMTEAGVVALAADVADGFAVTPFTPCALALGAAGPTTVWVKDETGNVGGSHKSRHLVGILLHLRAAAALGLLPAGERPPLAIASCGNAAIAAATLAQRSEWPLQVYVPDWATPAVLDTLEALGASITVCERRDSDPPGDPAVMRFREAVATGALPFSVQGPENGMCLDGGRTIGWEMADAVGHDHGPERLDRAVVQVGGGALATCVGWGLGPSVRLDTVQAQGCAPLARAWWRSKDLAVPDAGIPHHWGQLMTPWERPHSLADGILDDETYDWLGVFDVMGTSGGQPLVVPEEAIVSAATIGVASGIPVSPTGAAGVAGLLVREGRPADGEHVAVIFSGVTR
jgi:threonine dehydratase